MIEMVTFEKDNYHETKAEKAELGFLHDDQMQCRKAGKPKRECKWSQGSHSKWSNVTMYI